MGDPNYFFDRVAEVRALELAYQPTTLLRSLPNHRYKTAAVGGSVMRSYSDLVVVGTVIEVQPGYGSRALIEGDREVEELTEFDDPEASGQYVEAVVKVARASDPSDSVAPGDEVVVQFGVLMGAESDAFVESLRGLDQVAIVLSVVPDGPRAGAYYPAQQGGLVGIVEGERVSFPGLGSQAQGFVAGIDTVDELLAAADGPTVTHRSGG